MDRENNLERLSIFNKKIKMKNLENVIKTIIREELQNYLICEMAYSLKEYKEKSDNLIPQIVENWCLIRYSSLSGEYLNLKPHWKSELKSHLNNIRQMKLKTNNSSSTKQNALFNLWSKRDLDKDENTIYSHIYFKFEEEGIPTEGEIFAQVISDFKNETVNIVNVLTSNSPQKIVEYVENI